MSGGWGGVNGSVAWSGNGVSMEKAKEWGWGGERKAYAGVGWGEVPQQRSRVLHAPDAPNCKADPVHNCSLLWKTEVQGHKHHVYLTLFLSLLYLSMYFVGY